MNPPYSSVGAPPSYLMGNKTTLHDDLHMGGPDESEVDVLNDETFGDCDLETIKIKSDFGENGEFLGDAPLPDFFGTDAPSSLEALSLNDPDDQSQQPSIDALLGEEPMRIPIGLRSTSGVSTNPLFSMAISQARETNSQGTLFNPPSISRLSPMTVPNPPPQPQPQINIAMLKQYEQMLINRQVPAHERLIHLQALIDHLQRQASARPTNPSMMNMNNGHDRMGMGEMMERARRTAMNTEPNLPLSSQLIDAIQRSDQLPLGEVQQKSHSPSSPKETIVSPSHHRHNRPSKFYPRPPMLNTWQGRGPHHDEFAGMMSDLEKQRVVTIQLHQVTQTKDEDFYFQKWSQIRRQMQGTQLNRHDHRGQFIPYPILQLLKSIQQEKELADRLSQSSAQASFGNVNPSQSLPYAMPVQTQLGKQSIATPRHPRCTLHLDGEFTVAARANAITHEKYSLGLRLNIENLYRDLLRAETEEKAEKRDELLRSILQGYLNHPTYLFADMFADVNRGRRLLERLYPLLNSSVEYLEEILVRIYASLSYMIHRYSNTLIIEPIVMNIISSMQKEILPKFNCFDQISRYYTEQIRARLTDSSSSSPFADPILFTNPYSISILIEFLIWMERRCYLPEGLNSANLPIQILQQLQPQLHYQLTEPVRIVVSEICQALLTCSTPKKMLKPFGQVHHQTFGLLLKFLRIQFSNQVYPTLESKLIYTCVKND